MGMTNQRSSHRRDSGLFGHLGPERFRQANTSTGISPLRPYCLTREAACAAQCVGTGNASGIQTPTRPQESGPTLYLCNRCSEKYKLTHKVT